MKRSEDRIPTTRAGSPPRPDDLARMMWNWLDGKERDEEKVRAWVRDSVGEVVGKQRDMPDLQTHIIPMAIDGLNDVTSDLPPEKTRLHVCWGSYLGPHHHDVRLEDIIEPIAPQHILELRSKVRLPGRPRVCSAPPAPRKARPTPADHPTRNHKPDAALAAGSLDR